MREAATQANKPARGRMGNRLIAALVAVLTVVGLTGVVAGQATARIGGTQIGKQEFFINGCGMPDVKVRAWKKPGNYKTVILLDGMRAQYDYNGWEINTNVQEMVKSGVNVVEPIGGPASFYTDWDAPSNFNGQKYRYRWNCAITKSLVGALDKRGFRVGPSKRYAIMGLSMGGNAALVIGAQNRQHFDRAGSLSGYNFLSAPGMRTALRLAMFDVDPKPWNIDAMWGPPWSIRWFQNDPFWNIGNMRGMKIFVGSGNGLFGKYNALPNVFDDLFKGSTLELLAFTQSKAFEAAAFVQGVPLMTYYANGTHAWGYWQDMVWNAKNRGFFR
ncbi:alpha/beta hydrolase family protein [Gordonia rubripertincta]|uniref:Alpha/beta hydrolase family protein n=2 Tax=Gordonia rubripertincta TaxID=36822 RepID=A0AAW6R407_GORRU|nr:alpha/beta hydrolase family protein [Gordonia rubripertincta]MBM7280181.1 esterase family protein [Gordonia rubripertincta]MDG6780727.1 alpha/beta hydrolase family protein [Gordonia rubripertincta]NKY63167.1 esterase family protein [Gordonia rubripertincta]TSD95741.1 esterase family protein [Gordonia rubripertincta]GAB86356.1 putative mycolyltransferase [Gordonia rubripertincta NBRC 101908]